MFVDWYFAERSERPTSLAGAAQMYRWERRVASLWPAFKDAFRSWVAREFLRQDFEAMSDNELADIGMERAEIPAVVKAYPVAGRLQRRMMRRLGIDREAAIEAWPALVRAIGRACVMCGDRKQCERWLDAGPDHGHPSFCPNTHQLAVLKAKQAPRSDRL